MLEWLKKFIPSPFKRVAKRALTSAWESFLYGIARQHVNRSDLKHIIFVCKGNICRSAFAEKYMGALLNGRMVTIESCGLDVDQGGFSPREAVLVAREFGTELDSHRSKGLSACNFNEADLIVAMEYRQYCRLLNLFPEKGAAICVLREFAPWPDRLLCNIYDPYGLGEKSFRRCFRKMAKALDSLRQMTIDRTL